MFDFMFGGKRKIELIRELLEQRMRLAGFDDMDSRLKVKELSNIQLIGTPEGTLVTIIENILQLQKKGILMGSILETIENHRKKIGQDVNEYEQIRVLTRGSIESASNAVPMYCLYRLQLEHPGRMTEIEFMNAFSKATDVLMQD